MAPYIEATEGIPSMKIELTLECISTSLNMGISSCELRTAALPLVLFLCLVSQTTSFPLKPEMEQGRAKGQYLLKELIRETTGSLLQDSTGPYQVGWITEPEDNQSLNCSHLSSFLCHFTKADEVATKLGLDEWLTEGLKSISQLIQHLQGKMCSEAKDEQACESPPELSGDNNFEKLSCMQSLLVLYTRWMGKPPQ